MPVTSIKSEWVSGSLVFYEDAVGQSVTGDVLTIGTTAVKVGGTSQDVDFQWYGTGGISAELNAGDKILYTKQIGFKCHNHSIASGYVAEFKAEYNTTGTLSAVDTTVSLDTSMASVRLHGINCTVTNDAGVIITGTSYMHAINGQVNVQGTLNNANIIMSALRGVVAASSGTITAVNSLSCILLEMKETATITAGKASLLYGMVTGTTTVSSAFRLETNNVITNLFDITDNGGLVGSEVASIGTLVNAKMLKCLINGATLYIPAVQSYT